MLFQKGGKSTIKFPNLKAVCFIENDVSLQFLKNGENKAQNIGQWPARTGSRRPHHAAGNVQHSV
jgi:hypothetical protein